MATRFRLAPFSTLPGVSPARQSYTHDISRIALLAVQGQEPDSVDLVNNAETPDTSDHLVAGDAHVWQFVSRPLAPQTFTTGDAFKLAIQMFEAHNNNNLQLQIWMGLVSNDGNTALATLRTKQAEGTEMSNSLRNIFHSSTLSGGYTCTGGERLVVELSVVGTPTSGGGVQGHNYTSRLGWTGAGGDLPENDTETGTTFNPWLEFANTILFLNPVEDIDGEVPFADEEEVSLNLLAG